MKSRQISAGNDPPVAGRPWTSRPFSFMGQSSSSRRSRGRRAVGLRDSPSTRRRSCPARSRRTTTSRFCCDVPVLPAAGRSSAAPSPVPPSATTACSAWVTRSACVSLSTRSCARPGAGRGRSDVALVAHLLDAGDDAGLAVDAAVRERRVDAGHLEGGGVDRAEHHGGLGLVGRDVAAPDAHALGQGGHVGRAPAVSGLPSLSVSTMSVPRSSMSWAYAVFDDSAVARARSMTPASLSE